jgi:hypothetical protein
MVMKFNNTSNKFVVAGRTNAQELSQKSATLRPLLQAATNAIAAYEQKAAALGVLGSREGPELMKMRNRLNQIQQEIEAIVNSRR